MAVPRVTTMSPVQIALTLAGLVAVATVLGLIWRAQNGRVRRATGAHNAADLVDELGERATLLQFSTEFCAPCRATSVVLGGIATERADVAHVDIDLTERPEIAARFNILQTPTTLVLDSTGAIRARIGGAARRDSVLAQLSELQPA